MDFIPRSSFNLMIETLELQHLPLRKLLNKSGTVTIRSNGWSMFPAILKGDLLTIIPKTRPEVGDLVVFEQNGQWICHRLIRIEKDVYRTRGDNTTRPDTPIKEDNVLGIVSEILRRGNPISPESPLPERWHDRGWMLLDRSSLFAHLLFNKILKWLLDFILAFSLGRQVLGQILGSFNKLKIAFPSPLESLRTSRSLSLGSFTKPRLGQIPLSFKREAGWILSAHFLGFIFARYLYPAGQFEFRFQKGFEPLELRFRKMVQEILDVTASD